MENYNKNNINNTIINETSSQKQKKYEQNGKNNHSSMEIFSYSLMGSGASIIISIVVNWFTLYYETIIKLDPTLMIFAYLVYTVWDAINDPIVGYLSDKPNRFTRKYGKRFPWTISFSIPCLIFFILLFLPPDPIINEWLTFFWFLGIYCLWDTAYTIVTVNNQALLPSKYRSDSDRRKISAYTQILALLVYGTAATLPPILITAFGEGKDAYSKMALICGIIAIIAMIFAIPGQRESKKMIDSYYKEFELESKEMEENNGKKKNNYLDVIKEAFKQKNFIGALIMVVCIYTMQLMLITQVPYFVKYVMGFPTATVSILSIPFFFSMVFTTPLWIYVGKKYSHYKTQKIAVILCTLCYIPMFFATTIIEVILGLILNGIFISASLAQNIPLLSAMYDEAAVINGKRREGIYTSIMNFFKKFGQFLILFITLIVHELTNFNPTLWDEGLPQLPEAIIGVRFLQVGVPMIIAAIATIVMWTCFDLDKEKHDKIKQKLEEMGI